MDDPEVERFIEGLPYLRKFLRREGSLRRWHLEFEPGQVPGSVLEFAAPDDQSPSPRL